MRRLTKISKQPLENMINSNRDQETETQLAWPRLMSSGQQRRYYWAECKVEEAEVDKRKDGNPVLKSGQ